ncbi:MAG: hypothetical protein RPT25_00380 [Cycloclasticus sp.]|jgi:hypothetical protein
MKALAFLLLILPMLLACDNKASNENSGSKIVARVGDVYINDSELNFQIKKLTGLSTLSYDQKKIRDNVLESMVLSKLMSQEQKMMMNSDELFDLEQEVNAYREERLTQKYLSEQVVANPPSKQQVKAFYESNLHRFGGGDYAHVEYWVLSQACQFKNNAQLSNKQLKKQLLKSGCNQSQHVASELKNKLAKTLGIDAKNIIKNKAFWFTAKEGQKVAFIKSTEQRKAKPLVEVVANIRKMLAPMQLKTAIAETKSHLIKEMEIEYFD